MQKLSHAQSHELIDHDRRPERITARVVSVNCQPAVRLFIARDKKAQTKMITTQIVHHLCQQLAFDRGVAKITVAAAATAQISERAARIMRMVRQNRAVNWDAIEEET